MQVKKMQLKIIELAGVQKGSCIFVINTLLLCIHCAWCTERFSGISGMNFLSAERQHRQLLLWLSVLSLYMWHSVFSFLPTTRPTVYLSRGWWAVDAVPQEKRALCQGDKKEQKSKQDEKALEAVLAWKGKKTSHYYMEGTVMKESHWNRFLIINYDVNINTWSKRIYRNYWSLLKKHYMVELEDRAGLWFCPQVIYPMMTQRCH